MSVAVLQSKDQYNESRAIMKKMGIDCVSPLTTRILHKLNIISRVPIGDSKKSWDVLRTVQFIEKNLRPNDPILDIGAYGSEILCVLHKLNFTNLSGIDLNVNIHRMPHSGSIHYYRDDFTQTSFPHGSFDAVTAISVIEHGFNPDRLLTELSRILKPGGFFIASVDYWPEKIDTSGIKAYGMEWIIFSEAELRSFFAKADSYGLRINGHIDLHASAPVIRWLGRHYTFASFVLQKKLS